jgi:hypothetical protein
VIYLSVQDTGTGIPARFLGSIFDPFVTTKPLGKGSGLGLYHAQLFVEKHNSAISVQTKEGVGSTFHLWFGEADFSEEQTASKTDKVRRHTLLVTGMPGENLQRTVSLLSANGYYVVPTHSEGAALEALYSPYFQFTGLIVLAAGEDSEGVALFERVRAHRMPIKTILIRSNEDREDLEEKFVRTVDVVISANACAKELLPRLRSTLEQDTL